MGKLTCISLMTISLAMSIPAFAEIVHVSTPKTSLVLDATKGEPLKFLYYGAGLGANDLNAFPGSGDAQFNAYPVYGLWPEKEAAMSAVHADGNMTLDMAVTGITSSVEQNGAKVTTVSMADKVYPFYVDVNYRTYPESDVIETWTVTSHDEKKPVKLTRFMSGYLPIRRSDVHVSQLYGSWANEGKVEEAPLPHNLKVIKNKDGVRNSHTSHAEVMMSLDGKGEEQHGRVIGAALCYGGNFKLMFDTDDSNYHHFFAGINEENSAYNLKKGEKFVTPALALTYSEEGLGGASRNFHKWGRNYRLANGDELRKVLLNSWEGVYFDINEEGMGQMMKDIADMGGELFVMDDGWFGVKYPRKNDSSSLGDWMVDTTKLPHGIKGLCNTADKNGIKFGIWIEPEMVNPKSELYERHPDWVIEQPNRDTYYYRNQLVLDMSNPKVQDYVFGVVDNILTENPDVAYFKWDCNSPITNIYSPYNKDKQGQLYIDHVRGIYNVLKRVKEKYPNVPMMLCSGGGARCDYEALKYFTEFWCSDNTDPIERVYIQWGFSQFFPAKAMAAHVTSWNKNTSIKFRTDVASMCKLGFDIGLQELKADELAYCQEAIANWKRLQPAIMDGIQYRLVSPYDTNHAAIEYVDADRNMGVLFAYNLSPRFQEKLSRVKLEGLDPHKKYLVKEINLMPHTESTFAQNGKVFSGDYLMKVGLDVFSYTHNTSMVIEITAK